MSKTTINVAAGAYIASATIAAICFFLGGSGWALVAALSSGGAALALWSSR